MSRAPRLSPQPWMTDAGTQALLAALTADGGAARFVGGCVRDALAGRPVKDIDLATPLLPEAVMQRCAAAGIKVAPTGLAHGTVTAIVDHRPYEITTLRRDVATDGRHATVAFTDDWQADAARRDLTMNALFCDADGTVTDFFGGAADLAAGRVRFVGEARRRIEEDYLRLLRFFRFHAHYGRGDPDAEGLAAATALAPQLVRISAERKRDELLKLLAAPDPLPVLRVMAAHDILRWVLPQSAGLETLARLPREADATLRLAALLPQAKGSAARAGEALKLPTQQRDQLAALLREDAGALTQADGVRRALYRDGAAVTKARAALAMANGTLSPAALAEVERAAASWVDRTLPIKGQDLLALGLPPGPEVGALLRRLEDWWIEQEFRPDRQALLKRAKSGDGKPLPTGD